MIFARLQGRSFIAQDLSPKWRAALLATTALISLAMPIGTASAQSVIDGGSTVDVPGTQASPWNVGGTLTVGDTTTGTLNISNGGSVTSSNSFLGGHTSGDGTVLVTGLNSVWNTDALNVGDSGTGTLTISNGGAINSTLGNIGVSPFSHGTVDVDGSGSTWTIAGDLDIGASGPGGLTISNGGSVTSGTETTLGDTVNGIGTVVVTGTNSILTTSGALTVGLNGFGTLTVAAGGAMDSGTGIIGYMPGSTGIVRVLGSGSTWTTTGDIFVGGDLAFSGQGNLTVADGGTITVNGGTGTVNIGIKGGGDASFLHIGGEAPDPGFHAPAAPGTLNAATVMIGPSGLLQINHTSTNYTFAPALAGTGIVNHIAGTTIFTADSSAFNGTVDVGGGTLIVDGALGGSLVVSSSGRLQGSGTVNDVTVSATIAPGNSIGTLNVGNIQFDPGSIYEVEADAAGQADKIAATGTATISGGTVSVLAGAGTYAPATTYTIITANGGVTGNFAGVTSNMVFLNPTLSYDGNNVYLTLTQNGTSFASIGVTPNQIAAGTGAGSLGLGNAIYDAVLSLSADQARNAFDQLSGEVYASAKTAQIEDSRFVRAAVIDRLRASFGDNGASSAPVTTYDKNAQPQTVAATTKRFAAWTQAFGSWGHWDSDGNAAKLDRDTGGFVIGGDAPVFHTWRLGLLAGYSHTSFDTKDRNSSGSSDNYHIGLYGGTKWGDLAFRSGVAYTWHDLSTDRSVAFPGFADSLESDYNAGTTQVFGELGYGIKARQFAVEPFANLAYVSLSTDDFRETGGAAALAGASTTDDAAFTTLGVRPSTNFTLDGRSTTAKGTLGWRHAFGDATPSSTLAFASGDAFTVAGVPIARDAAVVEAGFDVNLTPTATLGLSYGGQFGDGVVDQSVLASFNVKF